MAVESSKRSRGQVGVRRATAATLVLLLLGFAAAIIADEVAPEAPPENRPRVLFAESFDDDRLLDPFRMRADQQLQRKRDEINAGHPVHDRSPCASIPGRCACP